MGGASRDFDSLAADYDRLRPPDENWWELFEVLVAEGDLVGRRVLDVGCGTGTLAAALAERGARVWGVDSSEEMLARARGRSSRNVGFKRARAEALPFKDGWFERAVLRSVVHVLDRARAFAELVRVLGTGGRIVVATFSPEHFERFWLNDFFPSVERIDRQRFADPDALVDALEAAGFADPRVRLLRQRARLGREEALERIRGRYISTLRLLPPEELERGLERAERELPAQVEFPLAWAVLVAERP